VLYIVKGRIRIRWGYQLELSEEARPGDFIYVPPYGPHHEINASPNEVCEAVVVRDGQDPIVVYLDRAHSGTGQCRASRHALPDR